MQNFRFAKVITVLMLSWSASTPAIQPQEPDPLSPLDPAAWFQTGDLNTGAPQGVQPIYVGPDENCDFNNLQDAINAINSLENPNQQLLVHKDYQFSGSVYEIGNLEDHIFLLGGYDACEWQFPFPNTRTILDAQDTSQILRIQSETFGSPALYNVGIRNFEFRNGSANFGGAIRISGGIGYLNVRLRNVLVRNSDAGSGGGIRVDVNRNERIDDPENVQPLLFIDDDSVLRNNNASSQGGGLHCIKPGGSKDIWPHVRIGNTLIQGNQAENGGGLSFHRCNAVVRAGDYYFEYIGRTYYGGVVENIADQSGGGIYASNGSTVNLSSWADSTWGGVANHAAMVLANEAKEGGGIYATDADTLVNSLDGLIYENTAHDFGGGVHVTDQAAFVAQRMPQLVGAGPAPCQPKQLTLGMSAPPCSRISRNEARMFGGGIFVANGAEAWVYDSYLENNRIEQASGNGQAVAATVLTPYDKGVPAHVRLDNTVVARNTGGQSTILGATNAALQIYWSTLTGNSPSDDLIQVTALLAGHEAEVTLFGSIAWENNVAAVISRGGNGTTSAVAGCIISDQSPQDSDMTVGFGVNWHWSEIDPEFIDPSASSRNYRLSPTSPAINYCTDEIEPRPYDLDLRPRDHVYEGDITPAPHRRPDGWLDIGAYTAVPDRVFRDRFEFF